MTIKEAIEEVLAEGVSKYKIAKVISMQPIMVDRFLSGSQTTIRREAAEALADTWSVEIDDHLINGHTKEDFDFKHKKD